MDDWSDLLACVGQIKGKNESDVRRQPGYLRKVDMIWENNT